MSASIWMGKIISCLVEKMFLKSLVAIIEFEQDTETSLRLNISCEETLRNSDAFTMLVNNVQGCP
jgi:hypothetical protein